MINKNESSQNSPLIISAVKFEVESLLKSLEQEQISYEYFELGVGPLHAAYKAKILKSLCYKRKVLYVGSCGSFAPFAQPYLIQAQKTLWMPTGVRTGLSHAVEKWYPPISFPVNKKIDLPSKIILTSPELSLTNKIANSFSYLPKEDLYENMELYAVADSLQEAQELNIALAVTNQVGLEGHEQWKAYFKKAAELTSSYICARKEVFL